MAHLDYPADFGHFTARKKGWSSCWHQKDLRRSVCPTWLAVPNLNAAAKAQMKPQIGHLWKHCLFFILAGDQVTRWPKSCLHMFSAFWAVWKRLKFWCHFSGARSTAHDLAAPGWGRQGTSSLDESRCLGNCLKQLELIESKKERLAGWEYIYMMIIIIFIWLL
jgi:hypothetical protein